MFIFRSIIRTYDIKLVHIIGTEVCLAMTNSRESEQRQHLSISTYAYNTIKNDSLIFKGDENYSGFINKLAYDLDRIDNFKKELTTDCKALYSKIKNLGKGKTLKIRLSNDLWDALYDEEWPNTEPYVTQGMYIKTVIEEYAAKSFYEREKQYFQDKISVIENAINSNSLLRVTYTSYEKGTTKKITESFKPYRISKEHEANYLYLIGLSKREDNTDYTIVSERLSRINVTPRSGSGRLKSEEKLEIENKILTVSVPYLIGAPMEFTIRLTPIGVNLYNSLYHLRPMYDSFDKATGVMTFNHIAERQFMNYFFNFGKDMEVISPKSTKEKLQNKYKEAYESYNCDTKRIGLHRTSF